ncbi:uncharacterized protein LOC105212074 [Zeugodacus cucurbitae]|uniref:Uncharacterized sulfatase yidJ n=1 Tax=Zeugodacus cucurbitae TaxID=28588 RepID=A0A0A1WS16_ZEUCU|nr:uncharacterized protein LOC105212074 [Zeugodacus cucurbitae]
MVEFWGIFVVFSACIAFQLTESRIQHAAAYRPSSLSASDELTDLSNSISDSSKDDGDASTFVFRNAFDVTDTDTSSDSTQETQTNSPQLVAHSTVTESAEESTTLSSTAPKTRLSLSERRQELYDFVINATSVYEKNYVGKTRNVLRKVLVELDATTEKSDALKEVIFEIKTTLKELEAFDIESNDLEEASSIVYDLNEAFDVPVNQPPELEAALEKVSWLDMRYELDDETVEIVEQFREKFNNFVATLRPWERLREAGLVDLNRRFNESTADDAWNLFDEFYTYFY